MSACSPTQPRPAPRQPAVVGLVRLFNWLHLGLLASIAVQVTDLSAEHHLGAMVALGAVILAAVGLVIIHASLHRTCRWAWMAQLAMLCLAIAAGGLFGLIWVPLLIAWCGPAAQDWFDPPMQREFGA